MRHGHDPPAADLTELRALCVAADLGTLGRAAVRLRVSQPSVSKRLRALEDKAGVRLLDRTPHGVTLTPAGRRLYEQARGLLEQADAVGDVLAGLRRHADEPVHLAASHSANEAFVGRALAGFDPSGDTPVELVTANSQVVRTLVADGRAELGVAAARPHSTPNPGLRAELLADDEIICAVPEGHRWARRGSVDVETFLTTPMVVRDPGSNARWTVDAVLRERGLTAVEPAIQAPTPGAAMTEAARRGLPLLLSRHVLAGTAFVPVAIPGLGFPRAYQLLLPAHGAPSPEGRRLIEHLRHHVAVWLR